MVKFSKELEAQLIPEWKDAFVNYWLLKKQVKKVKLSKKPKLLPNSNCGFPRPFYALLSAVTGQNIHTGGDRETIDQVNCRNSEDEDEIEVCETELVQLFNEEDEIKGFLEMLDEELNKVNKFYMTKETEFLERGDMLNRQIQILLDLKKLIIRKRSGSSRGIFSRSDSSTTDPSSDFSERQSEYCESPTSDSQTDDVVVTLEKNGINFVNSAKAKKGRTKTSMRIDIPATTPKQTISAVTSMLWEDLVNNPKRGGGDYVNRKKIQCAEKMIRGAFMELYRGLGLLRTYSSLNMVAFTKILKKFDKVSKQQASASYLRVVKRSHFISSDKVVRLMDEVESLFTHHFANNDRKKAMKFLRPQHNKDSHMVTFFVGLFTGSFVTLLSVYAILAHLTGMFSSGTEAAYMDTVYPIFSMFALLSLHLFMYGCNLLAWKSTRINYNFIFEFKPNTALKYRDAFLICTCLMTAVIAAMVLHLILLSTRFAPHQVNLIPGVLLLSFVVLLICPMKVFYRSTRFCFLRVIRNIVCSPLYKVLMVDFFMADQLTSQIPLLRHMESAACYFLAGTFKTHHYETCKTGKMYMELTYVISFAPYYWRAMQCARRWFDESNIDHLTNLGKYVSAMIAAGARLTYDRHPSQFWLVMVLATSVVATIYQLYWDFVKDWGLLNAKSKNKWLRDDLVLKNKWIYYGSIVLNIVLRVAWVESIMRFNIGILESRMIYFLLASLEVIRRGHWNFYRLENEHLNNVGKFRAVKTVPLPFHETYSDG